jgi:hypothetical protein
MAAVDGIQPVEHSLSQRSCGGCTLCCTVKAIDELRKPIFSKCSNECTAGCSIYNAKPKSCSDYSCLWLNGEFDERPDSSGILCDCTRGVFNIYETKLGALTPAALDEVIAIFPKYKFARVCVSPFGARSSQWVPIVGKHNWFVRL